MPQKHKNSDCVMAIGLYGMRWIFVIAGLACTVIATIIAISLPDLMR
jgi:hypothetical protein